ncbi:transglycosylase SLT domain-containing protein [Streptomyces sp. NPDC053493]|uniref:transglycosylase SLT domain-containing protein n=1 Tax=Streptomyces sp. NPDC053493 TaxID=3365705 RepID=UPI0037D44EEC
MRGHGKHRRPKNTPLARSIAAAGLTGSAALALPLAGATGAAAVTPQGAPAAQHVHTIVAVEKAAAALTAKKAGPVKYSVVRGDSLSKIARKYSVQGGWKKLYRDNRAAVGADPALIHPGLKLTVHASATPSKTAHAKTAHAKSATAKASHAKTTRTAGAGSAATGAATKAARPAAAVQAVAASSAAGYADNLDGWIRESLDIMARNGIPGTYDGIYRNVMRESSGNPLAINNWDSNALAGTPSKGLLQVIDPTFQAYHVAGTANDPYDPVANITAACNYAAARYGSIDNVFGAY